LGQLLHEAVEAQLSIIDENNDEKVLDFIVLIKNILHSEKLDASTLVPLIPVLSTLTTKSSIITQKEALVALYQTGEKWLSTDGLIPITGLTNFCLQHLLHSLSSTEKPTVCISFSSFHNSVISYIVCIILQFCFFCRH